MKSGSYATAEDLNEAIRKRAEEIYIRSGEIPGRDEENWKQAEAEILSEATKSSETAKSKTSRPAVVVNVNGVHYVGEYDMENAGGYSPGEFSSGQPMPVRIDGDKMFIQRPNGTELETRIIKKID